eukprot:CAMPEP_0198475146 /NCGR_PEP_ID=MMETSP1456-20131121/40669_1 /TAXON_ID=1461544 ORGANISM="Unidentified sp., Strain RCC1871" /NCGR_SAMPLE_ID=MMETSP1456 /ASSEMBLY_ACC=CAM_ASM_001119 /LENGTH=294 /DNA_ID=CAMNT_0044201843 /DNA_START=343 /DNA_END=1226 /DNA_ORIENTATION=+
MVYPLHADVQGLCYVPRWALLPGVGHAPQASGSGPLEDPPKDGRRVSRLGGVQAHADDLVAVVRDGFLKHGGGSSAGAGGEAQVQPCEGEREKESDVRIEKDSEKEDAAWVAVAQEAHDQGGVQAQAGLGVDAGAVQAVDHDRKRQSVALHRVRLGVEEDLGAPHTPSRSLAAVRHAEVVEIVLRPEHIAARVVQVQEALEVVEVAQGALRLAPGLGVAVVARKLAFQSVAQRDRHHRLRLESPLDVDVELGLGETPHEAGQLARVAIDRSRLGGAQPAALDAAKVDDVSHLLS